MKAAVLYGNDDIRYADWPDPELPAGKVKIAVKASGICGSDVPRVLYGGAHYYPIVLGHEFSGTVAEVGEGVTSLKVGDTVTAAPRVPCLKCRDCLAGNIAQCGNDSFIGSREQGSFAEYIAIPELNAVRYDPSVSFEHAVFFEPATVALRGILNCGFSGGGHTAIIGCGTIGLFAAQWARIFGARTVSVFDVDSERLGVAKALGVCHAFDSGREGFIEDATGATGGMGYDYVIDAVGNNATLVTALKLAAAKARVSLVGTPHDTVSFTKTEWELINRKEIWIRGCWQSYSAPFPGREWELTAECLADGRLRVEDSFIFRKYRLDEAKAAFDLFKNPSQVHGKVLLVNG
ncbi:MAG: galactitol-1-phosphate 5-dehydrogenase [Clostridiales Family XIII bacterium]|jgi:L-iditol 2-dehydrogenase|nr:galactitol-1-phosphate 5-dehydrogenase [Clostridiales Family XIII bacterium]